MSRSLPAQTDGAQTVQAAYAGKHRPTGAAWRVFCGDAGTVQKCLKADYYRCIVTSPPYFWQRDYGVVSQIGLEPTVDGYVAAICNTMDETKRVLHPRGLLFLNLGDTYYSGKGKPQGADKKHSGRRFSGVRAVDKSGLGPPKKTLLGMPWRIALAMIERGWILRSPIVWRRKNAIPEPRVGDRPWRSYEFVFVFSKSRIYDFSRDGLEEEDVWTIESQSVRGRTHPAVFPRELVARCLAIGNPSNGPVLDPFAGSGTVLRVAVDHGMEADGIDLSADFCQLMASALEA